MSAGILSADLQRPDWITMKWTIKEGKERTETFHDFKARLYQHEEAHLQGRLTLDQAVPGTIEFVTSDPRKEVFRDAPTK